MAAITALTRLVSSGDESSPATIFMEGRFVCSSRYCPRQGIGVRYVDTSDIESVVQAITPVQN
jgi:O-acetylhomoserine/O-acetylserine sulfhydrylase-like pyridoxal-dependent enzyme